MTTSGSCAIAERTQSRSVSEFPFLRGLPANARTLTGMTGIFVMRNEKGLDYYQRTAGENL
jgi:hypothetical protein